MQAPRRWVPGLARRPRPDQLATPAAPVEFRPQDVDGKDLAFCAEFAVHGGQAISGQGFKGEADLIRMQQAGLLDLERDPAPPFALVRVSLSAAARAMLAPNQLSQPATSPNAAAARNRLRRRRKRITPQRLRSRTRHDRRGRKGRTGGMERSGRPGGVAAVELRILTRIGKIKTPFTP